MGLLVVVPTRGRPLRFRELMHEFIATRAVPSTRMLACVDDDDPTVRDYPVIPGDVGSYVVGPRQGFMPRLNFEALAEARVGSGVEAIASFGDDHVPRTIDWDAKLMHALTEMGGGVVYPNDGFQGARCATAPVLSAKLVRALGWYAPPSLAHFWVDDFWMDLGDELGRLRYLGDVLVEHMHPAAHKAEHDDTYGDNAIHVEHDRVEYLRYQAHDFDGDVARVREALGW